jgi:anti-anti-sigma factor
MSERRRLRLPARRNPPIPIDDREALPADLPTEPLAVVAAVTGPCGLAPLTITVCKEALVGAGAVAPVVVSVAGEVDMNTAPLLQAALIDAVDRHSVVCCDLCDVTFFAAAGVTALIAAHDRAYHAGCRLMIRGAHGITQRVLHLSGIQSEGTDV